MKTPKEEAQSRSSQSGRIRSDYELPNALLAIAAAILYVGDQLAHLTKPAPDAANVCPECGEPFDFCAMGHYDVAKARRG